MKIENKKTEVRYSTSDPDRLLNRFTTKRVLRTWQENFMDEDTGEVVSIERNEVILERGHLIDRDTLSELLFYLQSGDIHEVEVSNQRRIAYEQENESLYPYLASVLIDEKNKKILFYATDIDVGIEILRDYVELNYTAPFIIRSIKDYDTGLVLIDNLKRLAEEQTDNDQAPDTENEKKYYQIEFNIENNQQRINTSTAVVQTFNVDRAMMLINDYIIKQEQQRVQRARKDGLKYDEQELTTSIESAKTISIHAYIPKEFSEAYCTTSN